MKKTDNLKPARNRFAVPMNAFFLAAALMFGPAACLDAAVKEAGEVKSKVRKPLPEGKITLPEFYGFYGVDGDTTVELKAGEAPLSYGEKVEFLLFDKSVSSGQGEWSIRKLDFSVRSGDWTERTGETVECRVKPVTDQPEMVRVVPTQILEPGAYRLEGPVSRRFFVEAGEMKESFLKTAQASMKQKQWEHAALAGLKALSLDPEDKKAREIENRFFEMARKAFAEKDWDNALIIATYASEFKPGDTELKNIRVESRFQPQALAARQAMKEKQWDTALERAKAALRVKPGDTEMNSLLPEASFSKTLEEARKAKDGGSFSAALAKLQQALELKPNNDEAAGLRQEIIEKLGMETVQIPAGCFQMGSDGGGSDEQPVHEVCVDAFAMDKHEATQAEFETVMGNNPSYSKGTNLPVESVTWHEADAYCRTAGKRLPTEAEWEYAARAGTTTEYYWGNEMDGSYAWYDGNSGNETHPVGQKKPNAWGLHDMSGNVWEWVADWHDSDYYQSSPRNNPRGPERGKYRVLRGGSWFSIAYDTRSAFRSSFKPGGRNLVNGFRCAQ